MAVAAAIDVYLRSGDTDPLMKGWPGDWRERAQQSRLDFRGALIKEVRRRTEGRTHPLMDQRWDHTAWMLANLHLEIHPHPDTIYK